MKIVRTPKEQLQLKVPTLLNVLIALTFQVSIERRVLMTPPMMIKIGAPLPSPSKQPKPSQNPKITMLIAKKRLMSSSRDPILWTLQMPN